MSEEKGKRFLELIDEQNTIQWTIISKLSALIDTKWDSSELRADLESMTEKHSQITRELNGLDDS